MVWDVTRTLFIAIFNEVKPMSETEMQSGFHTDISDSKQLFRICFISVLALPSLWLPFNRGFSYASCLGPISLSGTAFGHYILWLFAKKTHGARWWVYMSGMAALNLGFIVYLFVICENR
jgi:hypothetical protein